LSIRLLLGRMRLGSRLWRMNGFVFGDGVVIVVVVAAAVDDVDVIVAGYCYG